MKVIVTEAELQEYIQFEEWTRRCPCNDGNCLDVGKCLGCELHTEWENRRPSKMTVEEYTHSGLIHDLAVAQLDYAEAVAAKEQAEDRLNNARRRYDAIKSQIIVESGKKGES